MPGARLYDRLGADYGVRRKTDPRIAAALWRAIGETGSIANIGAGTGSYELPERVLVAVEPSMTMIRQRPPGAAPVLQAVAEQVPLRDRCVSVATAFLTIHHWADVAKGLEELRRIARHRVVLLTWDPDGPEFWLTKEYFPTIARRDRARFPRLTDLSHHLGELSVSSLMVPSSCIDGFLGAFWSRPHAYLDPAVRAAMSGFTNVPELEDGVERLKADLDSGVWHRHFGNILGRNELDVGYRIITSESLNS